MAAREAFERLAAEEGGLSSRRADRAELGG